MAAAMSPGELVERVRRDAERNVLRVRNGLKHLAGVGRPQLTQTPRETVWSAEKVELWHYPSDTRRYRTPLLFVHSLVSRSYVFDLVPGNSFVESMRRRRASTSTSSTGACPTSWRAATRSRRTPTATSRRSSPRCSASPATPDVNLFGYCFGGVLSLLSLAGNPRLPVRSLAVMATPIDMRHMGPMTLDDAGGPGRARGPPRRHRQRAGRRDAQLVPGARRRPATSSATSTCGRTCGTTSSSPPTR